MRTVLVIDDDECFQFLCEILFKRSEEECEVLQARDGVEALELLESLDKTPDLILLDINMPRMNGHEFLAAYAQSLPQETPVVAMLTSSEQEQDRENAMTYSFVKDYLLKPLRKSDIGKLMETARRYAEAPENLAATL